MTGGRFSSTPPPDAIGYTGINVPDVVLVLGPEGVVRRTESFAALTTDTIVIQASDVPIPACGAKVSIVDFQSLKIKTQDRALAMLAGLNAVISKEMLREALSIRFKGGVLEKAFRPVDKAISVKII